MKSKIITGISILFTVFIATVYLVVWNTGNDGNQQLSDERPLTLQWRPGSSQQYHLQMDSNMRMNTGGNATPQAMSMKLSAELDVYTLQVSGNAATVGMQLFSVDLRIAGQSDPATNRALETPFRVSFTSGGIPVAFEFPQSISAEHRGILENTIRTFQVSVRDGASWTARESNTTGSYTANYSRLSPTQVEKSKSHFSGSADNPLLTDAEVSSRESFVLAAERDWLDSMSVRETLRTDGRGGPGIEVTNTASIELISVGQWLSDTNDWSFIAATAPEDGGVNNSSIPNLTLEQARRQLLAAVPQLDAAEKGRSTWIHRLRDLLQVDDSLPQLLLEQLKTQELSDRTQADLYLALELAGTESAQAALGSVITDRAWSVKDNLRAIVALSGVVAPTEQTLDVLWETAERDDRERLTGTATFALGTLSSTLKRTQDPDYIAINQRLLSGATSGVQTQQRANYVHALGNTRDSQLSYDVAMLLNDDAPVVRRAAAQSLALLDVDGHADQLLTHFKTESNRQVRGALMETLVKWSEPPASAVKTVQTAIHSETDENTRLQMARFLGENLEEFPETKPVLENLLRTEQSKRIRQAVAESLAEAKGITGRADKKQLELSRF